MPDKTMTTLTASTEVAHQPSVGPDQWSAITFVGGGILALVMLVSGIFSIADKFIAWRRAGDNEDKGELNKVEKRVGDLEVTSRDFMPRAEIKGAIEHEKENRRSGEAELARRIDRLDTRVGDTERGQTRLETQQAGLTESMTRIERMVERVDGKLDRVITPTAKE